MGVLPASDSPTARPRGGKMHNLWTNVWTASGTLAGHP